MTDHHMQSARNAESEETITIEHSDRGTKVAIEDPTGWEVVAFVLLVAFFALLIRWIFGNREPK